METVSGRKQQGNDLIRPEIWGAVSAAIGVIVGGLVGFGVDLFGYAIATGPWASDKLKASAWILGAAAGLSFFTISLTVAVAARRLVDRQLPGDAVAPV